MNRDLRELKVAAALNTRERDYWKNRFTGELVKSSFSYDHIKTGPQAADTGLKEYSFKWEEPLYSRLMCLCKHSDYALHVVLAAALAALLGRYTGMEDIILATPIYRQEGEGQYINTVLPLQISLESSVTFSQLLGRVKQTLLEAVEHQAYPVELLPELLNMPDQGPGFPLFDVALELENIHPREYLQYIDLRLVSHFLRIAGAIIGTIVYDSLLYEKSTIERIVDHLTRFVQNALVDPGAEIFNIELLSGEEKTQLLEDFNDTQAEYPKDKTIHQLFEVQVERTPDCISLMARETREKHERFSALPVLSIRPVCLTYCQLNEQSDRLAHLLIEKGVLADDIIGIMMERSLEIITGILAILKAGGAYMPIDPDYPRERIDYMLKDSTAKLLVSTSNLAKEDEKMRRWEGEKVLLEEIPKSRKSSSYPLTFLPSYLQNSSNLAYVIYTSGTTGKPKGVMIENRAVVNFVKGLTDIIPFTENDGILSLTTITFDIFVLETLLPLTRGSKVFMGREEEQLNPRDLAAVIEAENISIFQVTPSRLQLFIELPEVSIILGSLKYLLVGGEAFPDTLLGKAREKMTGKIYNLYGPTETTVWSTIKDVTGEGLLNIGKPIANTCIYILGKTNDLQPVGVAGELFISGAGLARGYLNRPELTKQKFLEVQKPFFKKVSGTWREKIYRTGDLARWLPDGNIEFLGRIDQQVKLRGVRIELGEIENRLLAHKEIKDAVVVIKEDKSGDKYLCGYVVPQSPSSPAGATLTDRLIDYLAGILPAYMIPSYIVSLDRIPLTASGKIDRKALPELGTGSAAGDVYNPPADETERRLAALWSETLNIERETIDRNTNFFKIGGHSLKAAALIARIHKEFKAAISMMEVFDFPRLKDLAACIKKAGAAAYFHIQAAEKKSYYPLSSAQGRLYVIQQGMPSDTTYNITTIVILESKPDKGRMENTFRLLIARHESLRTSFRVISNKAVQEVHDDVIFQIESYDLVANEAKEEKQIIMNFIRPFDLSCVPLLRVGLIKITGERYILAVDTHHIISDAKSQEVLVKEFMHLYMGETLPELRLQYKDFSQWQNNLVISGQIKKQEAYWLNRFKGPLPILELPTDYPRPRIRSFEGSHCGFGADAAEVEKLRRLAARENASLFIVILAIYNVLLFKLSGEEDIIIGTAAAGRNHADLEHIIGVFINTLALRNFPAGHKSFNHFLREVRQGTLEAFDNQGYQFEDLVDQVLKERDPIRNPLFDVMFNFVSQDREMIISSASGLEFKSYDGGFEYSESRFDLLISGVDRGDRFSFTVEYSTRLFKKETILRFSQYFKEIIVAVVENENILLKDIPLSIDLASAETLLLQDEENDFGF